jgi:hypothetical protein
VSQLEVGLWVAAFGLTSQAAWQLGSWFIRKRNTLNSLLGELETNIVLCGHNRRRAKDQVYTPMAYQSYVKYRVEQLVVVQNNQDISVMPHLRKKMQDLHAQLLHQNEIIDISKVLWPTVLDRREAYAKSFDNYDANEEIIMEAFFSGPEIVAPAKIFEEKLDQEMFRRLQIGIAERIIEYIEKDTGITEAMKSLRNDIKSKYDLLLYGIIKYDYLKE